VPRQSRKFSHRFMLLLEHTPTFSCDDAKALARQHYGLHAAATALPSERDQNFLLQTDRNEKFVLKIANALEDRNFLAAQNEALKHLAHLNFCPQLVPTLSGEAILEVESHDAKYLVRMVTYLPGIPFAETTHSTALLCDLGRRLGLLDQSLMTFDHPAIHRDFHWDLANGLKVIREFQPLVSDNDLRALVDSELHFFERELAPLLPRLRQSAIHNDVNDYNVLVDGDVSPGQHLTGLIDFGDMVHSYTVADLAVGTAYAILGQTDPLGVAALVVAGYHRELPLNESEIAALFGLIRLRLCLSVCLAAHQQRQRPDDQYLSISQKAICELLPKLARIDSQRAEATFRKACELAIHDRPKLKREILDERRQLIGASVRLAYREPLQIVHGQMQYLYDETGREYLDAYNNVPHVGHCHPRVVKAGQDQMARLNTNTRYLNDLVNRFAKRLTATLPPSLRVCFFVNSGSEANELALRLARAHTSRRDMIVLEHAYHGNTTTLIDISPHKHNGPGGRGAPAWVHTAPIPDLYRGRYQHNDPQASVKYARHVTDIINDLEINGSGPAGFIAESMPSVAGQIIFPSDYLAAVYQSVRQAGGVCIADEVQTGYGRIGTHFWAFAAYDVVPDIVVLGKPIGNGHPIGAVITTPEIAASFANGMEFFSTFGGNTVSCAIGLEVLNVVLEEQLQEHARHVGEHLLARLRGFGERYSIIGDVRGSGLFIGVELVRNRDTREPATAAASQIVNRMREEGILLGTDGPRDNVIKIRPPLPFSRANADLLCTTLARILGEGFD
jgi:4-aminobutyrate aminotransferase-like enzyme/Ser/Thr protein kinase RdoA (MazF antagonist)